MFYKLTYWNEILNLEDYIFWKVFFHREIMMDLRLSRNNENMIDRDGQTHLIWSFFFGGGGGVVVYSCSKQWWNISYPTSLIKGE